MIKNIILALSIFLNVAVAACATWVVIMYNQGMFGYAMYDLGIQGICSVELEDEGRANFAKAFCSELELCAEGMGDRIKARLEVE